MLKITISKPMEKDQTYWFVTVRDAITFLNHELGIEPTRAGEQRNAPAEAGGGWWCECGWPNHDDEKNCSRPSCGRPRLGG